MCGIFGHISTETVNIAETIRTGLKRLEYRGYDSWGIAVVQDGVITLHKRVGEIPDKLSKQFPRSATAIGHTRWATHGGVTQANAHPHFSVQHDFCLAHNGIVENYQELKDSLVESGRKFVSETDSEVIVGLIEQALRSQELTVEHLSTAVRKTFQQLDGRNTVIILTKHGDVLAARNGSPLVIGRGEKGFFIASDALSFAPWAEEMLTIDNGQLVSFVDKKPVIRDIDSGQVVEAHFEPFAFASDSINMEGFDTFMLKEIHDTPYVLRQVVQSDVDYLKKLAEEVSKAKQVYTIGSGTAGIAASQMALYLRTHAQVNAISLIGAEAASYFSFFTKDDLIIAPSQSGETADVIEVLEVAKRRGAKVASYVNMPGSMMARLADFSFSIQAGPEICVMSTKVFTAMIAWGFLLAKTVAGEQESAVQHLQKVEHAVEGLLNNTKLQSALQQLAKALKSAEHIFLLSKGQGLAIAQEGMVKIVEATYHHAHAIPAGDLKHYAITIMEKGVPVIFCLSNDSVKDDVMNAVNQVKARGATVIALAPFTNEAFDYCIPIPDLGEASAIAAIIPLQLLAYYLAIELGHNVDKPRNIAKSVTVK